MPNKVLYYPVVGVIYTAPNVELAAGDEVTLVLDTTRNPSLPASITGIVQAVVYINVQSGGCPAPGRAYTIQYDSDQLEGAVTELAACDVTSIAGVSCCEALRTGLDEEIAARTAADTAMQTDLDTWDVIELTAAPSDGVAGVQQIESQTIVGTAGATGNVPVTFTAAGLTGSPLLLNVPVVYGDTDAVIAAKVVAAAEANVTLAAFFEYDQIGATFTTKFRTAAANDGTANVAYGAFTGLTPDADSTTAQSGVAAVAGTVPLRIGQHARWVNRIWEATSVSPATWVELNTELNSVNHSATITALTGAGGLDTLVVTSADANRVQVVIISGLAYVYKLVAGTDAESSPSVIRPDNYAAVTNEFVWKLQLAITRSVAVLDASTGGNGNADTGLIPLFGANGTLTLSGDLIIRDPNDPTVFFDFQCLGGTHVMVFDQGAFTGRIDIPILTASKVWTVPAVTGTFSLDRTVSLSSPLTGATTLAATTTKDEFIYVTPAGTIATHTLTLPAAANSRVGQKIEFQSSQIITALTVGAAGGGSVTGAALTAAAANTSYEFICTVAGTWLRIR